MTKRRGKLTIRKAKTAEEVIGFEVKPNYNDFSGIVNSNSDDEPRPFGTDLYLPQRLQVFNRQAPGHRGILMNKVGYISSCIFESTNKLWNALIEKANPNNETLQSVFKKIVTDYESGGNAWIEVVTNGKNYINIYHHDYTKVRKSMSGKYALVYENFVIDNFTKDKVVKIPLFPEVEKTDGVTRTMIHLFDYEPEFKHYGIPNWIGGLKQANIDMAIGPFNLSRVLNGWQVSGVFTLAGSFKDDEEAEKTVSDLNDYFSGGYNAGKVVFLTLDGQGEGKESKFTPINQNMDADWLELDANVTNKLFLAHGWFRGLTSMPDNTGFDTQRIINEYNVALPTVIEPKQRFIVDKLTRVCAFFIPSLVAKELTVINKPPIPNILPYMLVWEARKAMGLPYDEKDPKQQAFVATLNNRNNTATV